MAQGTIQKTYQNFNIIMFVLGYDREMKKKNYLCTDPDEIQQRGTELKKQFNIPEDLLLPDTMSKYGVVEGISFGKEDSFDIRCLINALNLPTELYYGLELNPNGSIVPYIHLKTLITSNMIGADETVPMITFNGTLDASLIIKLILSDSNPPYGQLEGKVENYDFTPGTIVFLTLNYSITGEGLQSQAIIKPQKITIIPPKGSKVEQLAIDYLDTLKKRNEQCRSPIVKTM